MLIIFYLYLYLNQMSSKWASQIKGYDLRLSLSLDPVGSFALRDISLEI